MCYVHYVSCSACVCNSLFLVSHSISPGLLAPLFFVFLLCLSLHFCIYHFNNQVISLLTVPRSGPSELHLKQHLTDLSDWPAFSCAATRRVDGDVRSWLAGGEEE